MTLKKKQFLSNELEPFACFSVKIVTNAECLFLGKKELEEDNNDAKKETE